MIETFTAAAILGIVTGLLSGMLGVGGGTVMIPIFRLAFGLSPVSATATSLFTIVPTSISGATTHLRGKTCVPKLGLALGIGGALTSPFGALAANQSPGWVVMTITAMAICYSGYTMTKKALKAPSRKNAAAPKESAPVEEVELPPYSTKEIALCLAIGLFVGFVSGFIGLGGGFLMVPLLVSAMKLPMKVTSGTSLVAILILAIPGAITQCVLGNVDFVVGIATACGAVPGAAVGARIVRSVPERALRFGFAAFLFIAAILLVVNEAGLLG